MTVHVLVADPAWKHNDKLGKRGAAAHYRCMPTADICAMPLAVGRDVGPAVLFLWLLENMQEDALAVVRAWGFVHKTSIIWDKVTKTGKPFFGLGRYTRASHERCIIATRGTWTQCRPAVRNVRSRFTAPVVYRPNGKVWHSAKPDAFYALVDAMYPHAEKHEMFARTVRENWHQTGHQLGKFKVSA
jgi:N6-adenosine-specific RNA methylase IME4